MRFIQPNHTPLPPQCQALSQHRYRGHTCPKDFLEDRNISNILEEAPPLRNKLEFGEPQASDSDRLFEPVRAT